VLSCGIDTEAGLAASGSASSASGKLVWDGMALQGLGRDLGNALAQRPKTIVGSPGDGNADSPSGISENNADGAGSGGGPMPL